MRNCVLLIIIVALLTNCGSSSTSAIPSEVPLPENIESLDVNVAALLKQTTSAIQSKPTDAVKWGVHASALFANGYFEPSVQSYAVALELDPERLQMRYIRAIGLWRLNRQVEAILELEAVMKTAPEYDSGWRQLAIWQLERGETISAEQSAMKAMELQPNRPGTNVTLARIYIDLDRPEDALKILKEPMDSGNAPPWIYDVAATCYRQLGNTSRLEASLAKAGPAPPQWPDPWLSGMANFLVGKTMLAENALAVLKHQGPKNALPLLTRALNVDPDNLDIRVGLSFALRKSGRLQDAIQVLDESTGEPNSNYWNQYASVSIAMVDKSGDADWLVKAAEYLQKSLALTPNDGKVLDLLAMVNQQSGNIDEAINYWSQAGEIHLEDENWQRAEISFAYALNEDSRRTDLMYGVARAQIGNKRFDTARASIAQILSQHPNDQTALDLLQQIPTVQE